MEDRTQQSLSRFFADEQSVATPACALARQTSYTTGPGNRLWKGINKNAQEVKNECFLMWTRQNNANFWHTLPLTKRQTDKQI